MTISRWMHGVIVGALGVVALSQSACTTIEGAQETAQVLSAQLTLVADEGQRFAQVQDELAQARLRSMHTLENSLVELEEENALDVQAWRVIGADFRIRLYEGVLTATNETAEQHRQRELRRQQQSMEMAQRRSAVQFQAGELAAAAQTLGLLATAPDRTSRDDLQLGLASLQGMLVSLREDVGIGSVKVEEALRIVQNTETDLVNKSSEILKLVLQKEQQQTGGPEGN